MKRALPLLLLLACGTRNESGLDQPFRVRNAAFVQGELPKGSGRASVTVVETLNNVVFPAQAGKRISGRTTKGAATVAMRFKDLGTGFYRIVTENPDPAAQGELTWNATLDFARDVPSGLYALQLVAFDAAGQPGELREVPLCISSAVPDNLSACDPKIAPPAAVISLHWDTNVDLDLQVVTPDGKTIDPKHPTTAPNVDGGVDPAVLASPRTGRIDRDSNPYCAVDGLRRESIVWQGAPQPGTYLVYANLFDACGQASVRFTVTLYLNDGGKLVEKVAQSGQLLAGDANGGSRVGLYLTDLNFE
jgi:hypothetical protein